MEHPGSNDFCHLKIQPKHVPENNRHLHQPQSQPWEFFNCFSWFRLLSLLALVGGNQTLGGFLVEAPGAIWQSPWHIPPGGLCGSKGLRRGLFRQAQLGFCCLSSMLEKIQSYPPKMVVVQNGDLPWYKGKKHHFKHIQDNAGTSFESSNYATKNHAFSPRCFCQLEGRRMSNKQEFRRTSKWGGRFCNSMATVF